jgi:hypothetical protein
MVLTAQGATALLGYVLGLPGSRGGVMEILEASDLAGSFRQVAVLA